MIVARYYSQAGGYEYLTQNRPNVLKEVVEVIQSIDAEVCRVKEPKDNEKNKLKRINFDRFYSPPHLNALIDWQLFRRNWELKPYVGTRDLSRGGKGSREMDACKDRVGLEVQLGKYSFLPYDIIIKMSSCGKSA